MKKHLNFYVSSAYFYRILLCVFSIFILGVSIGLNTKSMLGTDSIAVFFNGVHKVLNTNLGLSTNIINLILTIVVFLIDKKYINIGTLIYAVLLGPSINIGMMFYDCMNLTEAYVPRFLISIFGIMLAIIGLGIFISSDVGVDPWTAMAIIASKKFGKPFGIMKISIDILTLIVGIFLGGKVREITLISALVGGPGIQKVSEYVDDILRRYNIHK